MGSSCFSRGNRDSLSRLQCFIKDNGLNAVVSLSGCLCEGKCDMGPNVLIDDTLYTKVDPNTIIELLMVHINRNTTNDTGTIKK